MYYPCIAKIWINCCGGPKHFLSVIYSPFKYIWLYLSGIEDIGFKIFSTFLGKLQIRASGRTQLLIGDMAMDVSFGTQVSRLQNFASSSLMVLQN